MKFYIPSPILLNNFVEVFFLSFRKFFRVHVDKRNRIMYSQYYVTQLQLQALDIINKSSNWIWITLSLIPKYKNRRCESPHNKVTLLIKDENSHISVYLRLLLFILAFARRVKSKFDRLL